MPKTRMIKCVETGEVFISIVSAAKWLSLKSETHMHRDIKSGNGLYNDLVRLVNNRTQSSGSHVRSIYGYSFIPLEPKLFDSPRTNLKESCSVAIKCNETNKLFKNSVCVMKELYNDEYLRLKSAGIQLSTSHLSRYIRGKENSKKWTKYSFVKVTRGSNVVK